MMTKIVLFVLAMSLSIFILPTKGDLRISPSGLAAVFYKNDGQFVLECTSTNTAGDDNIIWELPVLYLADLLYYRVSITVYVKITTDLCMIFHNIHMIIGGLQNWVTWRNSE